MSINRKGSIIASLVAGAMRTMEDGEAAQARVLAGAAKPGDKKRLEQYAFLAELLAEREPNRTVTRVPA